MKAVLVILVLACSSLLAGWQWSEESSDRLRSAIVNLESWFRNSVKSVAPREDPSSEIELRQLEYEAAQRDFNYWQRHLQAYDNAYERAITRLEYKLQSATGEDRNVLLQKQHRLKDKHAKMQSDAQVQIEAAVAKVEAARKAKKAALSQ